MPFCIFGAMAVNRVRDPYQAYQWGLALTGTSFACTVLAWLAFFQGTPPELSLRCIASSNGHLFGRQFLALDDLNAPLVSPPEKRSPFLTAMVTARTHMRRFSFSWSMWAEVIRIATFSCKEPCTGSSFAVRGLDRASLCRAPEPRRPTRLYTIHMGLFVVLLVSGWALVEVAGSTAAPPPWWATLPLVIAILIRCGTMPAHCWMTDWFEHASLGIALLFVTPLSGVYGAVRLVLPIAPGWVLQSIGMLSLFTAVYAAGMATIQREARRFFAHLFLSHAALVLVGLELHTELSLCASLCLWFSAMLSLGGFGLDPPRPRSRGSAGSRWATTTAFYEHSHCFVAVFASC